MTARSFCPLKRHIECRFDIVKDTDIVRKDLALSKLLLPNMQTLSTAQRIRGALWGMFVGDALSMPVHWYYDPGAIKFDFGDLRDYQRPRERHPSSIMPLASTGKAGRGSQEGEVVGSVILKGKKKFWGQANGHYHQGMQAGDNTLNLLCARVLLRTLNESGHYDPAVFLRDYVAFMTAQDSHNDTYAESYHRDFFANYAKGVPPERCAGAQGHDTASIGGLVSLPMVILALRRNETPAATHEAALTHLRLTHLSSKLERYASEFIDLLLDLMSDPAPDLTAKACASAEHLGFGLASVLKRAVANQLSDLDVIGRLLSPACYIEDSLPAVLYLAARYSHDFEAALVSNAQVGGDNCHRGAVLGAILGATLGEEAIPKRWLAGLTAHAALEEEIDRFVVRFS